MTDHISRKLLAEAIAQALGWTLEPDKREYPVYHLTDSTTGYSLGLRWENYPKFRLSIHGNYPKDSAGKEAFPSALVGRPGITVDPNRGAAKIAADIRRRFLPDYIKVFDLMQERVNGANSYAALTEQTAKALEALGAVRYANNSNPHSITLHVPNSHIWQLSAQGANVRIEHCQLPLKTVLGLIPLAAKQKGED
jgi:hypothetical protein